MDDVGVRDAATTFAQLPLRAALQRALRAMRFHAPSPIQLRALPLALFGTDVIGQAKSGTGKTAVFGLAALEHVLQRRVVADAPTDPMVLVLAPTREIAMQIDAVLRQLAAESGDVRIVPLIGGLPIAQDQKRLRAGCHIAVGTPGRVRWLIEDGVLRPKAIRLLVFDEVDKLLSGEFLQDIDAIAAAIPSRRQTLAFSATFTADQLVHVVRMMRDPQVVRVRGPNEVTVELVPSHEQQLAQWIEREKQREPELWLRHVRQFYRVVPARTESSADPLNLKSKLVVLAALLSEIAFQQCIVFCNDKFRAEALATALETQGWPVAAITGAQSQITRNGVMDKFRTFSLRVLVSTDLTARGIDVDKVNFVVNLDLPRDPATYLHRVGRTGRFGGKHGLAVTLLTEAEVEGIRLLSRVFKMAVDELLSPVPRDVRDYVVCLDTPASSMGGAAVLRDQDDDDAVEEEQEKDHDEERKDSEVEEAPLLASDGIQDVEEATSQEKRRVAVSGALMIPVPDDRGNRLRTEANQADKSEPRTTAAETMAFAREELCYAQWLRLLS